jgi:hypothetical protein
VCPFIVVPGADRVVVYFRDAPDPIVDRTKEKFDVRGSGIVLLHDIHQRTADTLLLLLAQLKIIGYSVVRLMPKDSGVFGRDMITADAPPLRGTL